MSKRSVTYATFGHDGLAQREQGARSLLDNVDAGLRREPANA